MNNKELERVSEYIKRYNLKADSRIRERVYKRAYLYAYLRDTLELTYERIGFMFDRDHATIMHSIKKTHEPLMSYNDFKYLESIKTAIDLFPIVAPEDNENGMVIILRLNKKQLKQLNLQKIAKDKADCDNVLYDIIDKLPLTLV